MCSCWSYCWGADSQLVKEATEFGEYIGLCFQIKDDILDYFESKDLGKPTGNDMKEGKLTLPVLYALNSTQDSTYLDIAKKVRFSTATDSEIHQLIEFAKAKGGIDFAYKKIDEIKEKASAFLADAPQSSIISSLQAYLDYVVERNH